MCEIFLTPKQAKDVDYVLSVLVTEAKQIVAIQSETALDWVTCAKLVEGAPYTVKRLFEPGDVVYSRISGKYLIVHASDNDSNVVCVDFVNKQYSNYKLICKVENREKE